MGVKTVSKKEDIPLLFFSIIIPAHNEELYIEKTLNCISALAYPKERYETIVIENGSSDATFATAKKFENENTFILISDKKGVSIAKNLGVTKMNPKSDWAIFADADTILEKNFLQELNTFLQESQNEKCVIGTTKIKPIPANAKARRWFAFYDFGHKVTKTSYAIQIAKSTLLSRVHFPENLEIGEDLRFIADMRKLGKFFFFKTDAVFTSTRRFENKGWWKIFFYWNFVALLPDRLKQRFVYKVIR